VVKWTGPGRTRIRGEGAANHPRLSEYLSKARLEAGKVLRSLELSNIWNGVRQVELGEGVVARLYVLRNLEGVPPTVNIELLFSSVDAEDEDTEGIEQYLAAFGVYTEDDEQIHLVHRDSEDTVTLSPPRPDGAQSLDWQRGLTQARRLGQGEQDAVVLTWEALESHRFCWNRCTGDLVYRNGEPWVRCSLGNALTVVCGAALRTIGDQEYLYVAVCDRTSTLPTTFSYHIARLPAQQSYQLDPEEEDFPEWEVMWSSGGLFTSGGANYPVFFSSDGSHCVGVLGNFTRSVNGVWVRTRIAGPVDSPTLGTLQTAGHPGVYPDEGTDSAWRYRRHDNEAAGSPDHWLAADFQGDDTEPTYLIYRDTFAGEELISPEYSSSASSGEILLDVTTVYQDPDYDSNYNIVNEHIEHSGAASFSGSRSFSFPYRTVARLVAVRGAETLLDIPLMEHGASGEASGMASASYTFEEPNPDAGNYFVTSEWNLTSATSSMSGSASFNCAGQMMAVDLRVAFFALTYLANGSMSLSSTGTATEFGEPVVPNRNAALSYSESLRVYKDWGLFNEISLRNVSMADATSSVAGTVSGGSNTEYISSTYWNNWPYSTRTRNHYYFHIGVGVPFSAWAPLLSLRFNLGYTPNPAFGSVSISGGSISFPGYNSFSTSGGLQLEGLGGGSMREEVYNAWRGRNGLVDSAKVIDRSASFGPRGWAAARIGNDVLTSLHLQLDIVGSFTGNAQTLQKWLYSGVEIPTVDESIFFVRPLLLNRTIE